MKNNNLINDPNIVFTGGSIEIMRFEPNGDIFIKGKLVDNDAEVLSGLKDLLNINKK